jgi:hypothetical protein
MKLIRGFQGSGGFPNSTYSAAPTSRAGRAMARGAYGARGATLRPHPQPRSGNTRATARPLTNPG